MKINNYINFSPSRLNEFEAFLPSDKRFTFIEYGSASGKTLIDIKKKYPQSTVCGFDIIPVSLKKDGINIKQLNLESFEQLEQFKKEIMKANFHLFNDIIEHLSKPYDFLQIFTNMVIKNSIIIISCPNFKSVRFLSAWVKGEFPKKELGFFDKTHLQWFTKDELELYFINKSFTLIKSDFIYSKKRTVRFLQKIYPSRLCSQFQLIVQKSN